MSASHQAGSSSQGQGRMCGWVLSAFSIDQKFQIKSFPDIPLEICVSYNTNPRTVNKPVVTVWCYKVRGDVFKLLFCRCIILQTNNCMLMAAFKATLGSNTLEMFLFVGLQGSRFTIVIWEILFFQKWGWCPDEENKDKNRSIYKLVLLLTFNTCWYIRCGCDLS